MHDSRHYSNGRVVTVTAGDRVVVDVEAETVCQRCASGKGCGAGILGGSTRNGRVSALVGADIDLHVGDIVRLALQPDKLLRVTIMAYGYPLAGAVLGVVAALAVGLGDIGAALAALSGVFSGFLIARVRLGNPECLRDFTPVVVEKVAAAADG